MKKIKQKLSKIFTKRNFSMSTPWIPILGIFLVPIFNGYEALRNPITFFVSMILQALSYSALFIYITEIQS